MMAALVALESGAPQVLLLNRTRLAYEVSQNLIADRMQASVKAEQAAFLHMAAYITLCGGLGQQEALKALEMESAQTRLGAVNDPMDFLGALQAWLPGDRSQAWIGPIEPDIVGEAFVLGGNQQEYLRDARAAVMRAAVERSTSTIKALVRAAQDFSFLAADEERRLEPLVCLTGFMENGQANNDFKPFFYLSPPVPP